MNIQGSQAPHIHISRARARSFPQDHGVDDAEKVQNVRENNGS